MFKAVKLAPTQKAENRKPFLLVINFDLFSLSQSCSKKGCRRCDPRRHLGQQLPLQQVRRLRLLHG
jgi:hypothetical protein